MSEGTKWTPGPWRVDREPMDSIVTSGFKTALKASGIPAVIVESFGTAFALGVDVSAVPAYASAETAEANANLIASAPDLYEALAFTVRALTGQPSPAECRDDKWIDKGLANAIRALTRARGEGKEP